MIGGVQNAFNTSIHAAGKWTLAHGCDGLMCSIEEPHQRGARIGHTFALADPPGQQMKLDSG
jgi:hypothetical protein